MDIALPSVEQVLALLPQWRVDYAALGPLMNRYGAPPKALRHLGLTLWQNGDLQGATRLLAAAAVLASETAPFWSSLGGVLFAGGNAAAAAFFLRKALALDASAATDWLLLGTILKADADAAPAEDAFLHALAIDPKLTNATLSLGLLYMETRRFELAATYLRRAADGNDSAAVHNCLGQVLSNLGDFPGAVAALGRAVVLQPDDADMRHKWGQARFVETLVRDGTSEEAWQAYTDATGRTPDDSEKMMREAFHLLSGYGHIAAAIRLGEVRRRTQPDDPVLAYLLEALRGDGAARAPDEYLVTYFDKFADAFDKQLVNVLQYRVPEKLDALVGRRGVAHDVILDLGCGTGLAGPLLRRRGRHLTGVDLSPRMLDKATARALYDELVVAEAVTYLALQPRRFDLIFAADVFVYIGDLEALMRHAAGALVVGGLLAVSIETTDSGSPYRLLPSGRFAHAPDALEDLARGAFVLREIEPTMIRLEANRPVDGALMVFERQ